MENKNIIIILLVIIVILLVGVLFLAMDSFNNENKELELVTEDFGYITMLVPKGSDFKEYDNVGKGTNNWAIGYENKNTDIRELYLVWIGNYESNKFMYDYVETDGDMEIYKGPYNSTLIFRTVDGYEVELLTAGTGDVNDLKQMAKSIKVKKSNEDKKTTTTSTKTGFE